MSSSQRYRLEHPDGGAELASIIIETESVTLTRKDEAKPRSKGKPTRIPLAKCQGGSLELEAKAQALKLQAEGFVLIDADADFAGNGEKALYMVIRRSKAEEAIDYLTGVELPPGVTVGPYDGHGVTVRTDDGTTFRVAKEQDSTAVLGRDGPTTALALLLHHEGLADLTYDRESNEVRPMTTNVACSLAGAQREDIAEFLRERGLMSLGTVRSGQVAQAILM
jgi:hypothetical protein